MKLVQNNKVHVVAGPTASGKTAYAIELAQKLGGVLINADSRQIYKYLDIGTNKGKLDYKTQITLQLEGKAESFPIYEIEDSGIEIHLLSFLEPDKTFNAYAYQSLVYQLIPMILAEGKVPIIVGGTGLYIEMVLNPAKYQQGLRASASNVVASTDRPLSDLNTTQLQKMLSGLNLAEFEGLNESDRQNPRRLISRIRKYQGVQVSNLVDYPTYQFEKHYITKPKSELNQLINERVLEMFKQGLVTEVLQVLGLGYKPSAVALQGIGYRQVLQLLSKEISGKKCIELVQTAHRQYAKRQITWFKKYFVS